MGKNEAVRHNVGENGVKRRGESFRAGRLRGRTAVFSSFAGAMVRAMLMMILIATPSAVLTYSSVDSRQMVALIALFAGLLTFVNGTTYSGHFKNGKFHGSGKMIADDGQGRSTE